MNVFTRGGFVQFTLFLILTIIAGTLLHELGHALIAQYFGFRVRYSVDIVSVTTHIYVNNGCSENIFALIRLGGLLQMIVLPIAYLIGKRYFWAFAIWGFGYSFFEVLFGSGVYQVISTVFVGLTMFCYLAIGIFKDDRMIRLMKKSPLTLSVKSL